MTSRRREERIEMTPEAMSVRTLHVDAPGTSARLEAVCVTCGRDLIVVVGGGDRHHVGAVALSLSLPSIKDPGVPTNSSYLLAVPGHKEEDLARDGSLRLSKALRRNVVVTVGIHDDHITKEGIQRYLDLFESLIEEIIRAHAATPG